MGIASREYVKALRRQGVQTDIGSAKGGTHRNRHKVLIYHHTPHTIDIKKERKQFKTIIINTVWETTRIPRRWIKPINQADAVCVPSYHNVRALRNSGIKIPIYIVPHGVHAKTFTARKRKPQADSKKRTFTFLSVFGFQHRKNPEALLRAYWEEFDAADRVQLIIKTSGYSARENGSWIRGRIQAYKANLHIRKQTAPLQIITGHLGTKALRGLYAKGDAFVLPTRGEGVGLPFLEAMASGIPVITTSWGGQMDFITSSNSFLVPYKLQPPASSMNRKSSISRPFRHLFAEKGQLWAEVDIGSLRRQMRRAYENPKLCTLKGQRARSDALKLSWNRAGRSLRRVIEQVMKR